MYNNIKLVVVAAAILSFTTITSAIQGYTLQIAQGWNLLGNATNRSLIVASTDVFGDANLVTSVWKWDALNSAWAFYTPMMNSTELQTYAAQKNYKILTAINAGEGYWINAKTPISRTFEFDTNWTPALISGWNLISVFADESPETFISRSDYGTNIPNIGLNSLWAFDGNSTKWFFFAPSLNVSGELESYIASNSYLSFARNMKLLGNGMGFWVNVAGKYVTSKSYSGSVETVKYSDGSSVVNNATGSIITSSLENKSRTTVYSFEDGTLNAESIPDSVGNWLFSESPILLPDIQPIYSTLCANAGLSGPVLHKPIVLDLNKDGRKDIAVTFWCNQKINGLAFTGPVVNRVIAFLQQADGSFINGTKELFGTDEVSINGASGYAVVYDFNGDGYDDIAFAASPEDGRLLINNSTGVQSSYMMSSGDGKYIIGKFGTYQWGYSVHLMDNELGKKDVIATPIGYGTGTDAWRYNGTWSQIEEDYRWFSPNGVMFNRRGASENSHIAITESSSGTEISFSLFNRDANTRWIEKSRLSFGPSTWVPYTSWNTQTGSIRLITLDGQDYVMPYISEGCEMKIRPNEESVAIMQFGAYKLPTTVWDGKPLVEGQNQTWGSNLIGMSVANGTLTRFIIPVKNEITNFNSLHMSCGDVNGDGFDDIVVEQLGAGNVNVSPLIYLNDKNGGFSLVDPVSFPSASAINNDTSSMFVDLDGNGISDLMYWAVNGVNTNAKPVQFQIFKGLRNINSSDLK